MSFGASSLIHKSKKAALPGDVNMPLVIEIANEKDKINVLQ
jgi:PII-like signaling protein